MQDPSTIYRTADSNYRQISSGTDGHIYGNDISSFHTVTSYLIKSVLISHAKQTDECALYIFVSRGGVYLEFECRISDSDD